MLALKQLAIGGFDNNFAYFLINTENKECAIVDPDNITLLDKELADGNYKAVAVLITHSHFDHVKGVSELVGKYGLPIFMHKNAVNKLNFSGKKIFLLDEGDKIVIGGDEVEVLYTPGHVDDAVCYYVNKEVAQDGVPKLITGDTLFVGACGRADLAGSNVEDLYKSLQKIASLPAETEIYPGHDYGEKPVSTIAWEKKYNKYLLCRDLEEFRELRMR